MRIKADLTLLFVSILWGEAPLLNGAVIGAVVYTAMFSVGIGYTLQT